jgi:hypothetical protein
MSLYENLKVFHWKVVNLSCKFLNYKLKVINFNVVTGKFKTFNLKIVNLSCKVLKLQVEKF